jgi:DNA-binding MarR family transcriptional regulator
VGSRSLNPDPLATVAEFIHFVAKSAVGRRQRHRLSAAVRSPVTGAELAALRTVREHNPVTTTALASRQHLDRTTVSRVVSRLEELDLIRRTSDVRDGRKTWISVAPKGRKLLDAFDRVSAQDYLVATEHWSAADRAMLGKLLNRLQYDLERLTFDERGWAVGLGTEEGSATRRTG